VTRFLVLVALALALALGLTVPSSELDLSHPIVVPTQSTVRSACVKNGAITGGELGRCSRISTRTAFEVGRGIVPAGPRVSTADIVRSCGGCTDVLNRLVDPTSLLLVGTTLAGLGVVLRRLRQRRAIGGQ
jgi:hypothetical protein